jgi:hypothetical protein
VALRISDDCRKRLDELRARCIKATVRRVSRADLVRLFIARGFADLDETRPIADQLPIGALRMTRPPAPRRRTKSQRGESLRARIVKQMEAHPAEVFGPRRMSGLVGAKHQDTVRNALIALAERGRIEKLGPGQYRARGGGA